MLGELFVINKFHVIFSFSTHQIHIHVDHQRYEWNCVRRKNIAKFYLLWQESWTREKVCRFNHKNQLQFNQFYNKSNLSSFLCWAFTHRQEFHGGLKEVHFQNQFMKLKFKNFPYFSMKIPSAIKCISNSPFNRFLHRSCISHSDSINSNWLGNCIFEILSISSSSSSYSRTYTIHIVVVKSVKWKSYDYFLSQRVKWEEHFLRYGKDADSINIKLLSTFI